jgi:hypothetical protein
MCTLDSEMTCQQKIGEALWTSRIGLASASEVHHHQPLFSGCIYRFTRVESANRLTVEAFGTNDMSRLQLVGATLSNLTQFPSDHHLPLSLRLPKYQALNLRMQTFDSSHVISQGLLWLLSGLDRLRRLLCALD